MKFVVSTFLALIAPLATVSAEDFVYVNYSPDKRYSANSIDSRVVFVPERHLFGYGHDLGRLKPCTPDATDCLTFGFMAIASLPLNAGPGFRFTKGDFSFAVEEKIQFTLLGLDQSALRVTVTKQGQVANRFYFSHGRGVIAIGIMNFSTPDIPESIFFVTSAQGIFHTKPPL